MFVQTCSLLRLKMHYAWCHPGAAHISATVYVHQPTLVLRPRVRLGETIRTSLAESITDPLFAFSNCGRRSAEPPYQIAPQRLSEAAVLVGGRCRRCTWNGSSRESITHRETVMNCRRWCAKALMRVPLRSAIRILFLDTAS